MPNLWIQSILIHLVLMGMFIVSVVLKDEDKRTSKGEKLSFEIIEIEIRKKNYEMWVNCQINVIILYE